MWVPLEENLKQASIESKKGPRMNCGQVTDIFKNQLRGQIDTLKENIKVLQKDEL